MGRANSDGMKSANADALHSSDGDAGNSAVHSISTDEDAVNSADAIDLHPEKTKQLHRCAYVFVF